ncbi:MAG: trehalose-phosphatase [Pseudomonadota bacterium]
MPIPLKDCTGLIPPPHPFSVFLDVDGVLLEIADTPDGVELPPDLPSILTRLIQRCDGAVALVSGRSLAFLEQMFASLPLAMAGLHGVERRMPNGELQVLQTSEQQLEELRSALSTFAKANPTISLEDKGVAIAIHYRSAPEMEATVLGYLEDMLPRVAPGFHVQPGKMVFEVKPRGMDKGAAIQLMLQTTPFAGRQPIFAGDDVTDEHGFAVVNANDGISIKVGDGPETIARYHVETVSEMRSWLSLLASDDPDSH